MLAHQGTAELRELHNIRDKSTPGSSILTSQFLQNRTGLLRVHRETRLVNPMDANSLLSYGFFPKELPPPFTTSNLADYFSENKQTAELRKPLVTEPAIHNLARPGGQRRRLQIPNPFNYHRVCSLLEKHSDLIDKHLRQSIYTMSLPAADPAGRRALKPQADGIELGARRAAVRSAARFSLKADVSRFYGSIYTNSIVWALEGKNRTKKVKAGSPANQLHEALRDLQDGQTLGIPIGPDASLVIAEIVACAVDKILAEHSFVGMRFMDDYEFGFSSRPEAEAGLVLLEDALAEFELALNPQKTIIESLPVEMERGWLNEIKSYPFSESNEVSQSELIKYFNRVFDWKTKYPADAVLAYAVARLRSVKISDWKLLQDLVCQCALAEPGAMEPVVTLLYENTDQLFTDPLDKLIANTIDYHAPLSHGSELAWALWAAIWFKRPIPEAVAKKLERNRDAAVAVLTLYAKESGFISHDVSFSGWMDSLSESSFHDSQWLFAYEANLRGWLSDDNKTLADRDMHFSRLKSAGVFFFDPNVKAPTKILIKTGTSSGY